MLRNMANRIIDRLQEAFPPNRIAVLLTPVFAAASGWAATWAADNLPGLPPLDADWLSGVFIAGAISAAAAAYKWIDGWQKFEERRGG